MPLVIALTGGIGSGKTSVANILAELGAAVIDTDAIAHRLTAAGQPGARQIAEQFGAEFLCPDGSLDRNRMRELVFAAPASRIKLESILHPMIRAEVDSALRTVIAPYAVLVVPLLIETGAYGELAQRILVVDCSEAEQIARVRQRSRLSEQTLRGIMASQVSRADRLARADDVIVNNADLETLRRQTSDVHDRYLALSKTDSPGEGQLKKPKKPH